jgi:hypothetical protein
MKCAECRFWAGGTDGKSENEPFAVDGECHRKAPLPILVPDDHMPFGFGHVFWPSTGPTDFCGEFVAKAEKRVGFV